MTRILLAATLMSSMVASATDFDLDPIHSYVGFTVRHMMVVNQRGNFTKFSGALKYDDKEPTKSTVEVNIDLASVDTREPRRDEHLRSPDFFDVAKFPTMTFRSTKFEKTVEGFKVTGDLTLHGVTRKVVLDVGSLSPESKDPYGSLKTGTSATTTISRKDFGLTWNKALETGGIAVGDEVKISLDLELNRRK